MAARQCEVSFIDSAGIRHIATVEADTLYEAAAYAVARFRQDIWGGNVGTGAKLQIEVREPSTKHELSMGALDKWLQSQGRTPEEQSRKVRLKMMLMKGR